MVACNDSSSNNAWRMLCPTVFHINDNLSFFAFHFNEYPNILLYYMLDSLIIYDICIQNIQEFLVIPKILSAIKYPELFVYCWFSRALRRKIIAFALHGSEIFPINLYFEEMGWVFNG